MNENIYVLFYIIGLTVIISVLRLYYNYNQEVPVDFTKTNKRDKIIECVICYNEFYKRINTSDKKLLIILSCLHVFDNKCYMRWSNIKKSDILICPICNVKSREIVEVLV